MGAGVVETVCVKAGDVASIAITLPFTGVVGLEVSKCTGILAPCSIPVTTFSSGAMIIFRKVETVDCFGITVKLHTEALVVEED